MSAVWFYCAVAPEVPGVVVVTEKERIEMAKTEGRLRLRTERVGFEPTEEFPPHTLSKRAP